MAGTVTWTRYDRRSNTQNKFNVWEIVATYVLTDTSGGDEIKASIPINGILQKIICKSGAATGIGGTLTLAIDDNGDNEIFTAAGPAETATSKWSVSEPVSGVIDVGVDPNDDPTDGTWTIVVTLRGI